MKKNLTINGQAKKTFELNLSDCTWFSNWDEPQFIRNGIGVVRGAGSSRSVFHPKTVDSKF